MNKKTVVTRYAPSPTGFQHVGGVRTALYAWLWARKNQGDFILRIEDTDKKREVEQAISHTMESLQWLGLEWDYGPDKESSFGSCIQSERLEIYKGYALELLKNGYAYPDPYRESEVEKFRGEAVGKNKPFLYRNHRPQKTSEWDGTQPLRFKVPEIKRYTWQDAVRGELTAGEEMLDDFIILKADGYPTYNFAHIIDDLEMGVTHVMRGEEFISSTPKYLSLYEALDIQPPVFVTLPPIMAPDGKKKLSKRDGAKDILDYKKEGYLPEAMINFLALIGWNPGTDKEIFTPTELVEQFSIEKIQKSGGGFNEEKLDWINKQHLLKLSSQEKKEYVSQALKDTKLANTMDDSDKIERLCPSLLERANHKKDIVTAIEAGEYDYIFTMPSYEASLLLWKNDSSFDQYKDRFNALVELLTTSDFTTPESIKNTVWPLTEELGRGEVLWPMRTALSGREKSIDPFTLAYILGREETLGRIEKACAKIDA